MELIKLTKEELTEKIEKHRLWLWGEDGGERLVGAYDLSYADLSLADLRYADLLYANLSFTDLRFTDLRYANLSHTNLQYADLHYADLDCTNLRCADLHCANHIPYAPIACPSHGEFIAWKKVDEYIVKLLIPTEAKRCSAATNKCRCDKAFVCAIENIDGSDSGLSEITNYNYTPCTYKVGEIVVPDSFDDNRWNDCSHGIHFFIDREEAERWEI